MQFWIVWNKTNSGTLSDLKKKPKRPATISYKVRPRLFIIRPYLAILLWMDRILSYSQIALSLGNFKLLRCHGLFDCFKWIETVPKFVEILVEIWGVISHSFFRSRSIFKFQLVRNISNISDYDNFSRPSYGFRTNSLPRIFMIWANFENHGSDLVTDRCRSFWPLF